MSGLFGGLGDVRLILDTSAMLGYAIADHPACQLVPEPSGMADLHADYARFYEREDLAAAMVLAVHLGCVLGSYEADSYAVGGQVLDLVIAIEDGWKE